MLPKAILIATVVVFSASLGITLASSREPFFFDVPDYRILVGNGVARCVNIDMIHFIDVPLWVPILLGAFMVSGVAIWTLRSKQFGADFPLD